MSSTPSSAEKLLSISELAEELGVSTDCIYRWRMQGQLPATFSIGRTVRYRLSDVLRHREHCGDQPAVESDD